MNSLKYLTSFMHAREGGVVKLFLRFFILVVFANAQTSFANVVFTITPTQRVDTATQVTIKYSIVGAADAGTQEVGAYFVRVVFPRSVPANSFSGLSGASITRAPDNTPFGPSVSGPFANVSVSPSPGAIRWQAETVNGQNQLIDTTGALIGSFDLIWNRPASGQYDAGISASLLTGFYKVAPYDADALFVTGVTKAGAGVSTLISSVPEPANASLALAGLMVLLVASATRRRRS
jgi:hypothetical protein